MSRIRSPFDRQSGIGLIEVLVAMVVLSIGFLAAATMQVQGMRANQNAGQRAQALLLLGDMMDRMRGNPEGVLAGAYDGRSTGTAALPACVTASCTPAQLADVDLYEWSANFENLRGETNFIPLLPVDLGGNPAQGTITAGAAGVYTLSLSWKGFWDGAAVDEDVSIQFIPVVP